MYRTDLSLITLFISRDTEVKERKEMLPVNHVQREIQKKMLKENAEKENAEYI